MAEPAERRTARRRTREQIRREALELDAARQAKKSAQTRFYRELEKYMRSKGKNATAEEVLRAAEQIWHSNEVVRKLQPPPAARDQNDFRDRPVPRTLPKRVTGVVSGGLPGQKRKK